MTWTLVSIAQAHNLDITDAPTLQDKLVSLVQKLSERNKVVILIDEFESGAPSFLISPLRQQYLRLEDVQDIELSADTLSTFSIEHVPLIPLLFQTGYLTIVDYDAQRRKYKLNYPNLEVYESFTKYIVAALTDNDPASIGSLL